MAIQYNSNYDVTIPFSDVCFQVSGTANVEQTVTIPGSATAYYSARFGYTSTANIYVCLNATPVIPPGGTVGTQQYCEFRPGDDGSQRYVKGGDVLHIISPDATSRVSVSLRQLQSN